MVNILNSLWLLVSSPPSIPANLSNNTIEELRGFQNNLIPHKDADLQLLFWATVMVTIGVLMEFPEIAHAVNKAVRNFRELPEPGDLRLRWELFIAIGWVLVSGGLALEWIGDARINSVTTDLDRVGQAIIEKTQGLAIAAEGAAGKAQGSANTAAADAGLARTNASDAKTLASGARHEADSFAADIKSAKEQAADAVSRLADAEQRLADSTQREAAAEAKLSAIKTPRSLTNESTMVSTLAAFKDTEYNLMVFEDSEAFDFTKAIDRVLHSAGWIRKQHAGMLIGIPNVHIFGEDSPGVDGCLETGVNVHVVTDESLESLRSKAYPDLPKPMQAAIVLKSLLVPNISPSDERNVGNNIEIDSLKQRESRGGDAPLMICVGKKP